MSDPDGPWQSRQAVDIEDLRYQSHPLVRVQPVTIVGCDARALLAAVLQRQQTQMHVRGCLLAGYRDPEDAALLAEIVGRSVVGGQ
jgi:hypothetical protein